MGGASSALHRSCLQLIECDSFSQQDVKTTPAREKESHSAYLPSTVRPGELNLMTAGYGINHSEYSTPDTTVLHGIQLWITLPHRDMNTAPAFENFVPEALTVGGQGSGRACVRLQSPLK